MKPANQYSQKFQDIAQKIADRLVDFKNQLQDLELQIKYAGFKSSKFPQTFEKIKFESKKRAVVLNWRKDHRFHKLNALATNEQLKRVQENMKKLNAKQKMKITSQDCLNLNHDSDRFVFEVGSAWSKAQKQSLFERQFDIVLREQGFRLNLSEKVAQKGDVQVMLKAFSENRFPITGCIRFKRSKEYFLNHEISLIIHKVYQTEQQQEFEPIQKCILENEAKDMEKLVQQTLDRHFQMNKRFKYQIQMHFSTECLQSWLKKNTREIALILDSYLDMLRDLSEVQNYSEPQEIIGLIKNIKVK